MNQYMNQADQYITLAVRRLTKARQQYVESGLPADVRKARVAALTAKISALEDIRADPRAHPWTGDRL